MIRKCKSCDLEYDDHSPEKRRAGGLIIHCPDCSEETETKVAGVMSGSGKMSGIEILAFESEEDRKKYLRFHQNNSGFNKGKSCQLGRHLSTTPNIKFRKVSENHPNLNHKGKR